MGSGPGLVLAVAAGVDGYQAALLQGIRTVFLEHDVPLIVHVLDPEGTVRGIPLSLEHLMRDPRVRGVITSVATWPEQEERITEILDGVDIPRVHVGKDVPGVSCVHADNDAGMRSLMAHLLDECGVRRPVLVRGALHQPDSIAREAVFRQELELRGIPVDEEMIVTGRFHRTPAYREMRRLLVRRQDMDAVVAANDLSALGAMAALNSEGFRVPEQVVVTGFDNEPVSTMMWPSLTTVDQNVECQGETAAAILLEEMAGAPPRGTTLVPSQLLVRGSTARSGRAVEAELYEATNMAKAIQGHLATQDALSTMNRALMRCQTIQDVVGVLSSHLDDLGVERCFMVMQDRVTESPDRVTENPDGTAEGSDASGGTPMARMVLNYSSGRAQPLPRAPFPAHELLPETLTRHLYSGALVMLPMTLPEGGFGYVLCEVFRGAGIVADILKVDLGQALRTITSAQHREAEFARVRRRLALCEQRRRQVSEDPGVLTPPGGTTFPPATRTSAP